MLLLLVFFCHTHTTPSPLPPPTTTITTLLLSNTIKYSKTTIIEQGGWNQDISCARWPGRWVVDEVLVAAAAAATGSSVLLKDTISIYTKKHIHTHIHLSYWFTKSARALLTLCVNFFSFLWGFQNKHYSDIYYEHYRRW